MVYSTQFPWPDSTVPHALLEPYRHLLTAALGKSNWNRCTGSCRATISPVESIYYVVTWLCHRTCVHCYEDRFRPYYGPDLDRVVSASKANFARIIAHLPSRLTYRAADGAEHVSSIILAGGEVLLDPIREPVLYPALDLLRERYRAQGGVKLIVQTTGDLLRPHIISELLDRGVWTISVSGIDAYHAGLEQHAAQQALIDRLTGWFHDAGMEPQPQVAAEARNARPGGRYFQFFGATPDLWIGRLWPRGRAWTNSLTTATLADNFCNRWSGGVNFLHAGEAGSEVSIDPEGNVFPCCVKTRRPVGNLLEEPLDAILARARTQPIYQAINAGEPQRMGLAHGWSVDTFLEKSRTRLPDGREYQNLCIGCDAFHDEVLGAAPLVQLNAAG